ncbi:isochorismatase family protein [Hymenobacter lucidus]|nr:isochorismatase family protein [Hymenobacter lucidus]
MIDHQTGLSNGVNDQTQAEFKTNVCALADLGRVFNLPTIITASDPTGPNGPLMPEVLQRLPHAQVIHRPGEVNAWDNPEFAAAVRALGKKQLIIAGVSTEVCVAFPALAAQAEGFEVYAVIDSSSTWSKTVQDVAVARMAQAGIIPMAWVAVAGELLRDWRHEAGAAMAKVMGEGLPFYGNTIVSHYAKK